MSPCCRGQDLKLQSSKDFRALGPLLEGHTIFFSKSSWSPKIQSNAKTIILYIGGSGGGGEVGSYKYLFSGKCSCGPKTQSKAKTIFFPKFLILGGPQGGPFERFKRVQLLIANRPHHEEAICAKRKKVAEQFLRNSAKCAKIAPGGHLGGPAPAKVAWSIHELFMH